MVNCGVFALHHDAPHWQAWQRLIRVIGPGKNFWPCVYDRDLADLYFRLATHPDVVAAAKQALDDFGVGACGSPMLSGMTDLHRQLEKRMAAATDAVFTRSEGEKTSLRSAAFDIAVERVAHAAEIRGYV